MGERAVSEVEFLHKAKPLIRHHPERFDGKGYPDGLSGEEIPLGARIISIAETFDCIIRECTFQRPRSLKGATDEMTRHAGTHFGREMVRIFTDHVVSKLRDRDVEQYGELTPSMKEKELKGFSILLRVNREEPELGKDELFSETKTEHLDLGMRDLPSNQRTVLANSSGHCGSRASRRRVRDLR